MNRSLGLVPTDARDGERQAARPRRALSGVGALPALARCLPCGEDRSRSATAYCDLSSLRRMRRVSTIVTGRGRGRGSVQRSHLGTRPTGLSLSVPRLRGCTACREPAVPGAVCWDLPTGEACMAQDTDD